MSGSPVAAAHAAPISWRTLLDDDSSTPRSRLCREAIADGFGMIKLKVGADPAEDLRRMRLARARRSDPDFR